MKKTAKAKPAPKPTGRPSKYTPELVDEIAARLSTGEPLAAICRDAHMPHFNTVYNWMEAHDHVAVSIAQARARGHDVIAESCLDIADDREDDPASRRVRVDTRLKLLAKWNPKRYGDRVIQEHTGPDGGPVQIDSTTRKARLSALMQIASERRGG
jgi:hypothetical protein